jgi:hypothetical protein
VAGGVEDDMNNEKLLVPLSSLPGPVPVGAPLVDTDAVPPRRATLTRYEDHHGERPRLGVTYLDRRLCSDAGHPCAHADAVHPAHFALDLSPPDPPLSRVDGLDVGLRMLGGEPGRGASVMRWPEYDALLLHHDGYSSEHRLPCGINPDDPMARRLAVAAVLRAGGAT